MEKAALKKYIEDLKQEVEQDWKTHMFYMDRYFKNKRSSNAKVDYETTGARWWSNRNHLEKLETIFNS